MMALVVMIYGALIFVAVASIHHFGWEGAAIPLAVWLLMPQMRMS